MPTPKDNYALVKILVAPMCTEVSTYLKGTPTENLGHEAAGEVVEVAQPGRFKVGDRVVVMPQNGCGQCELCLAGEHIRCQSPRDPYAVCDCRAGRATYAEFCIQQNWLLFGVPDDLTIEHASMACCGLGPTFNAMQMMDVNAGDTVLISGLGPVGLGGVINARLRGARVLGIESNPYRAELARTLGAETIINPEDSDLVRQIRDLTGGHGADKSVECSSAQAAPSQLAEATRINGQLTSVGWGGPIQMKQVVARGLTVRGAWHWNHVRDGAKMLETIKVAGPMIDQLITHRFPLSNVKAAWELQATGKCGKVVLYPQSQFQ